VKLRVNGKECEVAPGTRLEELLATLKTPTERVAVERNRKLVRKSEFFLVLEENDELEVVTLVGGG
jgi:thiamine biosynthesis protein ThiS